MSGPNGRKVWAQQPQAVDTGPRFKVIRVQPRYYYEGVVCVDDLIWIPVHYHRHRSVPCLGDGCPVCLSTPFRYYCFIPAALGKDEASRIEQILEVPGAAALLLQVNAKLQGALKSGSWYGVKFKASRKLKTLRSPVVLNFQGVEKPRRSMDRDIALNSLCAMWSIPLYTDADDHQQWKEMVFARIGSDNHYANKKPTGFRR
jgi:hypothetical protein